MPINWLVDRPIEQYMSFDPVFKSNGVLISIAGTYPTTWVKAGYLEIAIDVDGQPFIYASKLVKLGNSVISIGIRDYKLSFNPVIYVDDRFNPTIKIAEQELNMGIQYPPATPISGPVSSTTLPVATVSTPALGTDSNRISGTVFNNTNRAIGISFNTTAATLSPPSKVIPAGGNMDLYEFYTGPIQYICTAGAAGTVLVDTVSNL